MMVFVGTHGIVSLPDFDNSDESFDFREELVPKPSHPCHRAYFAWCSYMDKMLANLINIGMCNEEAMSYNAKETNCILDDYCMSIRGFEMTWAITSGLAPRPGVSDVNCDPSTLIKTLVAKNGGSRKKFCTQAKNI